MKKIIQILIVTVFIISCDVISIERYYKIATELENQGRFKEAISYHDKILKKDSTFRPSLINRGADKSELKDYKGAILDYKKILGFDSDNLQAMMNIGNNYENLNDFNSAIIYYSKALDSDEIIKSGKFYAQIKYKNDFDKDYEYRINDYEILFERGTAFLLNKQYEKAISDLSELIKTGQMVGDAYYYIGESYLGMKDTINACANYKISIEKGISSGKEKIKTLCEKEL